jgi:hypothetical protein
MLDVIMDTLIDALKLLPFLFIAFLIIEYIEHKLSKKSKKVIIKAGKVGPLFGSLLGAIPQCGFSVMATNLYVTRIVTLGTLISVYLSTSDEMLPVLLSNKTEFSLIFKIIITKVIIGMFFGFIIDLFLRKKKQIEVEKEHYDICEHDHCDCSHSIFKSAIKHTLTTIIFILVTTLILNICMEYFGTKMLSKLLFKNNIFGSFITPLIALIPNCGSSVIITELYLNHAISYGAMMGGLLTASGISLLVLFKINKSLKENLKILLLVYFIGAISGIVLELLKF